RTGRDFPLWNQRWHQDPGHDNVHAEKESALRWQGAQSFMTTSTQRRNQLCDGRALNPRIHPNDRATERHQGAGVSGTDAALRFSVPHETERNGHRGVFLVAKGMGGPLVHTNDIGSLDNADTGMPLMQQSLELTPDSHQNK